MGRYAANLNRTLSTTQSLGSIGQGGSLRRHRWIDIVLGCDGTPGDTAVRAAIQRCTALGTSTAVTPVALDPGDTACSALAGHNHTVEPTYTGGAVLLQLVFNQRSTVRWFAAPGEELVCPATSANGIGIQTPVAPSLSGWAAVVFEE
jgi:hypothetical protein